LNYDFYLIHSPTAILLKSDLKFNESTRPQVGQKIQLPGLPKIYRILRSDPANNPTGQKVSYYLVDDDPENNPFDMSHTRLQEESIFT